MSTSIPGWISSGPWLAWQEDVIRLPAGPACWRTTGSGRRRSSAGGHLGLQFHPEITPKILGDWIAAGRAPSLDSQGVLEVTSREYATASVAAERLLTTYIHSLTDTSALNTPVHPRSTRETTTCLDLILRPTATAGSGRVAGAGSRGRRHSPASP